MMLNEEPMTRKAPQLNLNSLTEAADCLRILAHPNRLQIVQLLLTGKKQSVNELAQSCGMTQPATSDHLRLMQRCGFLDSVRDGRTVYYSISEPHLKDIMGCIQKRFG
jgi:DNA-binding transcriptional ArsR family regulator